MFANLVIRIGEKQFWPKFLHALSVEDADKIINRNNDHFEIGHNPDSIEERMKFINDLPENKRIEFGDKILRHV